MKERPIIFSTEMVNAILQHRKTQTRRIIRYAAHRYPNLSDGTKIPTEIAGAVLPARESGWIAWYPGPDTPELREFTKKQYRTGFYCPYGVPGDRLWVKETFSMIDPWKAYYKADLEDDLAYKRVGEWVVDETKWRPSIFMPRKASRIDLEVVEVRVQRLNDITQEDAVAEGMTRELASKLGRAASPSEEIFNFTQAVHLYGILWDKINAKRGYPWALNPWVWAVTFKEVKKK